jgi:hypothetical protein
MNFSTMSKPTPIHPALPRTYMWGMGFTSAKVVAPKLTMLADGESLERQTYSHHWVRWLPSGFCTLQHLPSFFSFTYISNPISNVCIRGCNATGMSTSMCDIGSENVGW